MNLKRLKKLRDFIANQPAKTVDMGTWLDHLDIWDTENKKNVQKISKEVKQKAGEYCGTFACIAGYACLIMPAKERVMRWESFFSKDVDFKASAQRWLELDPNDDEQSRLFYASRLDNESWKSRDKTIALKRLDKLIARAEAS